MKPFAKIDATAVGVDPIASPASVKPENIVTAPFACGPSKNEVKANAIMLWTESAGGNVTVELYCRDESTGTFSGGGTPRFRLLGVATVIGVSAVVPVVDSAGRTVFPPGEVYPRVTAGNGAGCVVHLGVA